MADNLRTPPEVTKLGKAAASYFDTINRLLSAPVASVEVPLGGGITRVTVDVGADSYRLDTTGVLPANFIRATGQSLARADYPDLFVAFGIPDGTDTLTLPNNNLFFVRVL